MQKNNIFYKLLSNPYLYYLSQKIMSGVSFRENLVKKYIKKRENLNVLDIGCGPADILSVFKNVNYYGYDINPHYISHAKKKFLSKNPKLFCKKFDSKEVKKLPKFDVILLLGIIHHLNEEENKKLLILCKKALKKGGFILTEDPILIKKQNFIARFLVKSDRGLHVKDRESYLKILSKYYRKIESEIHHQKFIPYTWFSTKCSN